MKWLGQYIQDLPSRFHDDVIIESVDGSSITMIPNAASGPLKVYQPVNDASPNIFLGSSDTERMSIRAFYASGTQTLQTVFLSSATASATANYGAFRFNVDGTNILDIDDGGIDLDLAKGISISGVDILTNAGTGATTLSNINTLDATTISTLNTALTAGDITGVTAGIGLSGGGTSGAVTLNVDAAQTQITSIGTITEGEWRGTAINQTYLTGQSGTNTGDEDDAASDTKGIVELATTAEADTGTDTNRAVTPAGLKSHIDARYSYQYIPFLADSDAIVSNQFIVPGANGISNHAWNTDTDLDYTGTDAVTIGHANAHITMDYLKATASIIVPQACDLVGFYAVARNEVTNNNSNVPGVGIFVSEESDVDWGGSSTWDARLRAYAVSDGTGNEKRPQKIDGMLATPFPMTAGDLITPAVVAPTSDQVKTTITLVLRTLIG